MARVFCLPLSIQRLRHMVILVCLAVMIFVKYLNDRGLIVKQIERFHMTNLSTIMFDQLNNIPFCWVNMELKRPIGRMIS